MSAYVLIPNLKKKIKIPQNIGDTREVVHTINREDEIILQNHGITKKMKGSKADLLFQRPLWDC